MIRAGTSSGSAMTPVYRPTGVRARAYSPVGRRRSRRHEGAQQVHRGHQAGHVAVVPDHRQGVGPLPQQRLRRLVDGGVPVDAGRAVRVGEQHLPDRRAAHPQRVPDPLGRHHPVVEDAHHGVRLVEDDEVVQAGRGEAVHRPPQGVVRPHDDGRCRHHVRDDGAGVLHGPTLGRPPAAGTAVGRGAGGLWSRADEARGTYRSSAGGGVLGADGIDSAEEAAMNRPVIIGYDGSEGAGTAVEWGAAYAARHGAPAHVVRAFEPHMYDVGLAGGYVAGDVEALAHGGPRPARAAGGGGDRAPPGPDRDDVAGARRGRGGAGPRVAAGPVPWSSARAGPARSPPCWRGRRPCTSPPTRTARSSRCRARWRCRSAGRSWSVSTARSCPRPRSLSPSRRRARPARRWSRCTPGWTRR